MMLLINKACKIKIKNKIRITNRNKNNNIVIKKVVKKTSHNNPKTSQEKNKNIKLMMSSKT